jgi:hypothetical protein
MELITICFAHQKLNEFQFCHDVLSAYTVGKVLFNKTSRSFVITDFKACEILNQICELVTDFKIIKFCDRCELTTIQMEKLIKNNCKTLELFTLRPNCSRYNYKQTFDSVICLNLLLTSCNLLTTLCVTGNLLTNQEIIDLLKIPNKITKLTIDEDKTLNAETITLLINNSLTIEKLTCLNCENFIEQDWDEQLVFIEQFKPRVELMFHTTHISV